MPVGVGIKTNGDPHSLKEVLISIEADTTLEDIKAAWPNIKSTKKKLRYYKQDKFQPLKKFDRDQRAYELQLENKTNKQIATILTQEFKNVFSYAEIPKIIQRHKKRLGMN